MSYEQFWDGDCEIARMYRKAHALKMDEANHLAWLQGAYVYSAVGALAPALKAFAKGRVQEYMKKPFNFNEKTEDKPEPEKPKTNQARIWMEMWAINFNQKLEEKQTNATADQQTEESKNSEAIKDGGANA